MVRSAKLGHRKVRRFGTVGNDLGAEVRITSPTGLLWQDQRGQYCGKEERKRTRPGKPPHGQHLRRGSLCGLFDLCKNAVVHEISCVRLRRPQALAKDNGIACRQPWAANLENGVAMAPIRLDA